MNSDLEYIISNYSGLKLVAGGGTKPLKDLALNSPLKEKSISNLMPPNSSSSGSSGLTLNDSQTLISTSEIFRICYGSIDSVQATKFPLIKSLDSKYLKLISSSFAQIYKLDLITSSRLEVFKKFKNYLLKLIDLETNLRTDFSFTLREIRHGFNYFTYLDASTNNTDTVRLILLTEVPMNPSFATALMFITLQILYKKIQLSESSITNNDLQVILEFFFNDQNFKNIFTKFQKESIVKLILSFISRSKYIWFKLCLNIKFLQLLNKFNLKIEDFISNYSLEKYITNFEHNLLKTIEKDVELLRTTKLMKFIYDYIYELDDYNENILKIIDICQQRDENMEFNWNLLQKDSNEFKLLIKLLNLPQTNIVLIKEELMTINQPTESLITALGEFIKKSIKDDLIDEDLEFLILYYLDNFYKIQKSSLSVLDKLVISSNLFINSPSFIDLMFTKINQLLINNHETKRMKNISNLYYNFGIKLSDQFTTPNYLLNSLKIETEIYLLQEKKSLGELAMKFLKCLKYLNDNNLKYDQCFLSVFNNDFFDTISEARFIDRFEIVEQHFAQAFTFLDVHQRTLILTSSLSQENKTFLFCLFAKYTAARDIDFQELYDILDIEDAILQMMCGIYCPELPVIKPVQNKSNILNSSSSDSLIKSCYYLTLEIKNKLLNNIHKILSLYITSWIPKNKYGLSSFEVEFIQRFVDYLNLINYSKTLDVLLSTIEQHYTNFFTDDFKNWLFYEKTKNHLQMRSVNKVNLLHINKSLSKIEGEVSVDVFTSKIEYMLLQMRYHLIKFDKEQLKLISSSLNEIIESNSTLFSISNTNKYPIHQFRKLLTLLAKIHSYSGKFLQLYGLQLQSILSFKRSLQLSRSILRKDEFKNDSIGLINLISSNFKSIIRNLIHLGISKDTEYYIEEFEKFNESIIKFKSIYCQNCYFICYYYFISGKMDQLKQLRIKADLLFQSLKLISQEKSFEDQNKFVDDYGLIFYHYLTKLYEIPDKSQKEVKSNLTKFLNAIDKENKFQSDVWRLYYEYHFRTIIIDVSMKLTKDPYLNAMNYLINSNRLFTNAKKSLEIDPVFSTLEESAMSIPSIKSFELDPSLAQAERNQAKNVRNLKKALVDLKQAKNQILEFFNHLNFLSNFQINEIHKIFALDLLTLSSISDSSIDDSVHDLFKLGEYLKHQPMINEKLLVENILQNNDNRLLTNPNFKLDDFEDYLKINAIEVNSNLQDVLPSEWLVISIDVCSFNGDLIINKTEKGIKTPRILRLPLGRHSSRTLDEASFGFKDAINELNTIIKKSNETTSKKRTDSIETAEDRKQWHAERMELDEKLGLLLSKIQYTWLGGFKGIFNSDKIPQDQFEHFKTKFIQIMQENIPSRNIRNQNNKNNIEIDDFIIELFIRLGDISTLQSTELLEDLIYFVLDILLFHGEENAYDEIDIDNIYVELEGIITDYRTNNSNPDKYKHTVLVLGKECLMIPWESLPCLRDCSTTRIGSLSMLLKLLTRNDSNNNNSMSIDRSGGSFILNPTNDLPKTAERMRPVADKLEEINWEGITGIKPTEKQFQDFLISSNLFIFIGHGSGSQFIKSTTLKSMNRIAPTLLLGCSSAALKDQNLLEPYGTIFSYLIGGCPMVVGNLWDVTDKDLDKFSLSVFNRWGLTNEENLGVDICEAVNRSRDECNLKYLNGSAPVVYGLPLSLR